MALRLTQHLNLLSRALGLAGPGGEGGYLLAGTTDMFYLRPDGSFYLRAGS